MDFLNRTAAAVVGLTLFGLILLGIFWSVFGGFIKAYAPNELGYSELGWVHSGWQTHYAIGVPKWAGWEGFASALQSPLRHRKVYLKQGQKIVADYEVDVTRGAMSITMFRTNLSRIFQGARVDNHKFVRLRPGTHKGTFEYVAPADGIYRFKYDIWWDRKAPAVMGIPTPDYELTYDIRWRLER